MSDQSINLDLPLIMRHILNSLSEMSEACDQQDVAKCEHAMAVMQSQIGTYFYVRGLREAFDKKFNSQAG